jgi:hypothetical protein
MTRSCEEDPPFDYVLMLLLDAGHEALTVLPTHRLVLDLGDEGATRLSAALDDLFEVSQASRDAILEAAGPGAPPTGGRGRIGFWTRAGGSILDARRAALEPFLPPGGATLRELDVTTLGVTLERLAGIDDAAVAAGRLAFTHSAVEAMERVDGRAGGADAAFLLRPTAVADVIAVAADGDVMPQKSTYFYPKAATGLVINPHEW